MTTHAFYSLLFMGGHHLEPRKRERRSFFFSKREEVSNLAKGLADVWNPAKAQPRVNTSIVANYQWKPPISFISILKSRLTKLLSLRSRLFFFEISNPVEAWSSSVLYLRPRSGSNNPDASFSSSPRATLAPPPAPSLDLDERRGAPTVQIEPPASDGREAGSPRLDRTRARLSPSSYWPAPSRSISAGARPAISSPAIAPRISGAGALPNRFAEVSHPPDLCFFKKIFAVYPCAEVGIYDNWIDFILLIIIEVHQC
jgi:hypothetical protein